VAGCTRRHPDFAARDEALLVGQAETFDAEAYAVMTRQWEQHAAAVAGPDPVETPATPPSTTCRWRHATRPPSGSCSTPTVRYSTSVGSPARASRYPPSDHPT
jgi:hypothetical protein